MYFQEVLQGIASNLMDSNLFQLKSSTFCKTYRWVPVTWGFLPTYFQASVGLFFWEYQIDSLIWVIGHLATGCQTFKMPKAKYMSLNISLAEARMLSSFEPKCNRKAAHVKQVKFRKFLNNCVKTASTLVSHKLTRPGLPPNHEAIF